MKNRDFLKNSVLFFSGIAVSFALFLSIIVSGYFILTKNENWEKLLNTLNLSTVGSTETSYTVGTKQTVVEEESTVISVVENVSNSVVSIAIKKVGYSKDFGPQQSNNNIGTGFIISGDGLIATNQHVVSDLNVEYSVTTKDHKTYKVTNVYRDEVNDIAFVRVDTNGDVLPAVKLGNSDSLKVGQIVIAIGTPLGDYPGTVTTGVVSGLERTVSVAEDYWTGSKEYEGVIQTDAAINPGNSGGPLLNLAGEVVGINFATTSGADNISFAIPVNLLKTILEDFNSHGGKFVKAYMGVSYQIIDEFDAIRFDVPVGAFVDEVEKDGPADKAGIVEGDIIIEIGGKSVENGLRNVVLKFEPGETVTVKLWRKTGETYQDGEYKELQVTLGEKEG